MLIFDPVCHYISATGKKQHISSCHLLQLAKTVAAALLTGNLMQGYLSLIRGYIVGLVRITELIIKNIFDMVFDHFTK